MINIYLEAEGIMENIRSVPGYETFSFTAPDIYTMTRREDSILAFIYEKFVDDNIEIEYDPMSGMIKAGVITPRYDLSVQLCTQILNYMDGFYSGRMEERNIKSLDVVSTRLDSVLGALNAKQAELARLQNLTRFQTRAEETMDIMEVQRDITALTFMYNEAVQAREATKSSIRNPTSSINIIDHPVFSTHLDKRDKTFWMIIGGAVGLALSVIFILVNKSIQVAFEEEEEAKRKEAEALAMATS